MTLLPFDTADQFEPGAIGPQAQIKPEGTETDPIPQHGMGQKWTGLKKLHSRCAFHRHRMLAIILRQIPGIPELPPISESIELQRCRQLLDAQGITKLEKALIGEIERQPPIADAPDALRHCINFNGISDLHRLALFERGALEGQSRETALLRELHPDAATGSALLRQHNRVCPPVALG